MPDALRHGAAAFAEEINRGGRNAEPRLAASMQPASHAKAASPADGIEKWRPCVQAVNLSSQVTRVLAFDRDTDLARNPLTRIYLLKNVAGC